MTAETGLLILTAFSIGFVHTILGPDHYVPFVAMSLSNRWSRRKTAWITALCGVGHILGSVVIGAAGLLIGSMVFQLESIEAFRADIAAWLLIGFGLAYLVWGVVNAVRDIPHTHLHSHADGTVHSHLHKHDLAHRHLHRSEQVSGKAGTTTPWILFLIFVFGPCEVLIPLLMYPAAKANFLAIAGVVTAFAIATIATMVASVMLLAFGLESARLPDWHRFSQALAGLAVLLCGVMVKFGM